MQKHNQKGPEFSRDREFAVVLEDLRGQFQVFGEGLTHVQKQLERFGPIESDISQLKTDMAVVKAAIPNAYRRLDLHETRIVALESTRR